MYIENRHTNEMKKPRKKGRAVTNKEGRGDGEKERGG